MLEAAMAGLGGVGGGMLGQIGEGLSLPRRALMKALGMPESGTELLHQTFGMDPESVLTKALGFGAEMALDPLTYAGMGLGSLGGKFAGRSAEALAGLEGEVGALTAARRAAQEGLVER